MGDFICQLCGNTDEKYIGYFNGQPYCRRCISYRGKNADDYKGIGFNPKLTLEYRLTKDQEFISKELLNNYKNKKNSLVHAVCGAGKTELVYKTIDYAIKNGRKVGFSIPRRDVVIELEDRIKCAFKNAVVKSVYGGKITDLYADIILLTTHQLYRYPNYFDLLILDEIDAFPFKGDYVLNEFFKRSVKGNFILLSATPSKLDKENFKASGGMVLELYKRFHGKKLPVPKILKLSGFSRLFKLYIICKKYYQNNIPFLIFVPSINLSLSIYKFLNLFFKNGYYVHSKLKDRAEIIQNFKSNKLRYLVTTSVLERGVTIANLNVIIYNSDHKIYDEATLIQISGRVGRKQAYSEGDVYYLSRNITFSMINSINEIKEANKIYDL